MLEGMVVTVRSVGMRLRREASVLHIQIREVTESARACSCSCCANLLDFEISFILFVLVCAPL